MTDLIKQVGGIEKAKGIVDGAPCYPVFGWCAIGNNYIFEQCESAPCNYSNFDNAWSEEYVIDLVLLKDLRQAIADYNTDHCSDIMNHVSPSTQVYDK